LSEQKVHELDHALLIMATFVPFVYITALNYAISPTPRELLLVLPFLFVAVALPLYVGYLRPAVEGVPNPNSERARGWIYLFYGGGLYAATLAEAPYTGPVVTLTNALVDYGFVFVMLVLTYFSYRFIKWLYKSLEYSSIPTQDKASITAAMIGTFASTLFFAALVQVFFGKSGNTTPFVYSPTTGQAIEIAFGLTYLAPLLALEIDSHHNIRRVCDEYDILKAKYFSQMRPNIRPIAISFLEFVVMTLAWAVVFLKARNIILAFVGVILTATGSILASDNSVAGVVVMILGDAIIYLFLFLRAKNPAVDRAKKLLDKTPKL